MLLYTTLLSCLLMVLAAPIKRQVPSSFQIELKGKDKCITPTLDGEDNPIGALSLLDCKEAKSWRFTNGEGKVLVKGAKGFFESTEEYQEIMVIDGRDVDNYSAITSLKALDKDEVMQKWHLGEDSRLSLPKQKDPGREELCLTADELVIKTMGCLRGDKAKKSSLKQEWKFK